MASLSTLGRPALGQDAFETIFSSRGTRWSGLTIEKSLRRSAERPCDIEVAGTGISYFLQKTELGWVARGERRRCAVRPGTTVFIKEGCRLNELAATTSQYDKIGVRLESAKVTELMHDDVRAAKVDFFEHLVANDDQTVGMLSACTRRPGLAIPEVTFFPNRFLSLC